VLSSMSCLIPNTATESISTRPTSAGHTGDDGASHSVVPKPGDGSAPVPSDGHTGTGAFSAPGNRHGTDNCSPSFLVTMTEGHHL
jgi:hypothetical protein